MCITTKWGILLHFPFWEFENPPHRRRLPAFTDAASRVVDVVLLCYLAFVNEKKEQLSGLGSSSLENQVSDHYALL